MATERILIVDDDEGFSWMLKKGLSRLGFDVACVGDGVLALSALRNEQFDLVVLDINMPKLDGIQVCHQVRNTAKLSALPILFLTGYSELIDCVRALEGGGDDYMIKPFHFDELAARIKALLRRAGFAHQSDAPSPAPSIKLDLDSLSLDLHTRCLSRQDQIIQLTSVEFDLLKFFMEHPNQIYSSSKLLRLVWNYPEDTTDTGLVRWHIKNLRDKIEPDPQHPTYLHTVSRQGYIFQRRSD